MKSYSRGREKCEKRRKKSERWFEDAIIYVRCGSTSRLKKDCEGWRKGIKMFDV
jgi:hypothetical protein